MCPFCGGNDVENEFHVLLNCSVYQDLREALFAKASLVCPDFSELSNSDKYIVLFSNANMIKTCAKTCSLILKRRQGLLCK